MYGIADELINKLKDIKEKYLVQLEELKNFLAPKI